MSRSTPAKKSLQYLRFMVTQLPTVLCRARAGFSHKQHVHQHPWHFCRLGPDSASHLNSSHHRSLLGHSLGLCSLQLLLQVWNPITVHHVHDISAEGRRNSASVRWRTVSQAVLEMGAGALLGKWRERLGRQIISNDIGLKMYLWSPRGIGIRAQVF